MDTGHSPPRFGPTSSVVEAFLQQLRHVPQQYPHIALHQDGQPIQERREALTALAASAQEEAAVQTAQLAVSDVLQDISWPTGATAVRRYVEQTAPQVATILTLQGYVAPARLADDYERIYVNGWQHVFGEL